MRMIGGILSETQSESEDARAASTFLPTYRYVGCGHKTVVIMAAASVSPWPSPWSDPLATGASGSGPADRHGPRRSHWSRTRRGRTSLPRAVRPGKAAAGGARPDHPRFAALGTIRRTPAASLRSSAHRRRGNRLRRNGRME